MQHTREHEFVDVLGTVAEMRSHRLSMVQTEVSPGPGALPGPATGGSLGRPHRPAPPPAGAVRVHPPVRPADVAEEEAAAVAHLRRGLREHQQDVKVA